MGGEKDRPAQDPVRCTDPMPDVFTRRQMTVLMTGASIPGCLSRSGAVSTGDHTTSPAERTTTDVFHPDLSPRLEEVANADDPARYATERGYQISDGSILVVVDVRSGDSLPGEFVESVEYQYQNRYEAFVRFDNLVPLASDDAVRSVRLPAKPSTNAND